MKKDVIIIAFICFLFTGCSNTVSLKTETITISDKTKEWEIDVVYTQFSSSDDKVQQSYNKLNLEIQHFVDSLQNDFKTSASGFFNSLEDIERERPDWKCPFMAKDTIFMANDRYVSIRFATYTFLGGANGLNKYYAFNYDVQNQRFLSKEDILDSTSQIKINNLLEKDFKNPFSCFTQMPAFDNVTTINIAPNDIFFTYEQYVLGARVCGDYQTFIPKEELGISLKLKDL